MERNYRQEIEDIKRTQEIVQMRHEEEKEEIRQNYEKEMELLESKLRSEQFNLLRSLTFEKNDIEKQFQKVLEIKERELEDKDNRLYDANEELKECREEKRELQRELSEKRKKLKEVSKQMEQLQTLNSQLQEKCASIRKEEEERVNNAIKDTEVALDNKHREETEEMIKKHVLEMETLKTEYEEKVKSLQQNAAGVRTLNENNIHTETTIGDKDAENRLLKVKYDIQRREIINEVYRLKEELRNALTRYEQGQFQKEKTTQSINSSLKDIINVHIKSLQVLYNQFEAETINQELLHECFTEQIKCLDLLLKNEELNEGVQIGTDNLAKLNELLQIAKRKILWSYNIEKLHTDKKHRERERQFQNELVEARNSQLERSVNNMRSFHQMVDIEPQNTECLQLLENQRSHKKAHKQIDTTREEARTQQSDIKTDLIRYLRKEKANLMRALDEMSNEFKRERNDLLHKNFTQHREYVMSDDAEIVEKLLRQKSSLEEALNLERFYLSRLYYLEMSEELKELLSSEKDKIRKQFDQDKLEIVLKYSKEIADLHNILAEKEDRELQFIQEREETIRKALILEEGEGSEVEILKSKWICNKNC